MEQEEMINAKLKRREEEITVKQKLFSLDMDKVNLIVAHSTT